MSVTPLTLRPSSAASSPRACPWRGPHETPSPISKIAKVSSQDQNPIRSHTDDRRILPLVAGSATAGGIEAFGEHFGGCHPPIPAWAFVWCSIWTPTITDDLPT